METTRRPMGADSRNVTIVHMEEDVPWCDYIKDKFKADQLNLKIATLNVTSMDCHNHTELQRAVDESYVVMLLTTCYLLDYMEKHYQWLVSALDTRNKGFTTIVAARLDVTSEDLSGVMDKHLYNQDNTWERIEINADGTNIMQCISEMIGFSDKNIQSHDRFLLTRTNSIPAKMNSPRDQYEVIPKTVQREGDIVALIFNKEKPKGAITLCLGGINIPVETLNPYCVTFKAPVITGTKINITMEVNNERYPRIKLYSSKQTPQFSSVELMYQSYRVNTKEDLDRMLAAKFISTVCDDREAVRVFSSIVQNTSSGKCDSQYPTLLHWAAANGLKELCSALLSAPGANEACNILNWDDDDVADLAEKNGYMELANYITEFTLGLKHIQETKEMADVCDFYMQSLVSSPAKDSLYETMISVQESPPPVVPRTPTAGKCIQLSPLPDSHSDEDDNYIEPDGFKMPTPQEFLSKNIKMQLPQGAIGSRSQTELIEIQEEVKRGNFSIREAEMLFKSWKCRYETGNAISFRERQQSLQTLREQHKKTMEVLKAAQKKGKEKRKKSVGEITELANVISEPIGMRLKTRTMMPQSPGQERAGNGRGTDRANHDSGRFSGRESTLSQNSTSSEDIEFEDDRHILRNSRPQSEKAAGRLTDYRQSVKDLFLELHDSQELPEDGPPPLPPRLNRTPPTVNKLPPRIATKPSFNKVPKLPVPSKNSTVFNKQ